MTKPNIALYEKLNEILLKLQCQPPSNCLQCAKCTSGCQVMRLLENKPHEVVGLVGLGFLDELIRSDRIWECALCLKCRERCPQRIAPTDILLALRNLAVSSGVQIPESYSKMIMSIIEHGLIQGPQEVMGADYRIYTNETLGLEPTKPRDLAKFRSVLLKVLEQNL